MKIIKPYYEIMSDLDEPKILQQIEKIARTCYKSEDKITEDSAKRMVKALIKNGHHAMLEHFSFTVKFVVDRAISLEIVRHRIASFAQESTRYCDYSKDKFNKEITFIVPLFFKNNLANYETWVNACETAERDYFLLLANGAKPEEARTVLPNSLKTEICVTMNLREWRHFFELRALDKTGKAHPQMKEVTVPLLEELKTKLPAIFGDLE